MNAFGAPLNMTLCCAAALKEKQVRRTKTRRPVFPVPLVRWRTLAHLGAPNVDRLIPAILKRLDRPERHISPRRAGHRPLAALKRFD
ncbi:MAG TPA: hypothetical protein PLW86_19440 [Rhodocyclaceae bacterium]|nr:hypothetical protein [Rhodocyclaceae bacterium]